MKIQQVRFKNLNSLVGEWEIDLTHQSFASDGIFAITGPTGAGKTTILDAICLALYGRTPRINKVAKSGNEVMSRQTGECFAEVTFETQTGRYRCHWSQRRARKKPDGELQSPKHEIANAVSGDVLESKIKGVADRIEAATGMDFDRFTRSMLLAQGGFAAFLQASPDERAPILEQITGTEIYSQISMRVHERRSEEKKSLDVLQAELAGIQLLSSEDEQQLTESLEVKSQEDNQLTKQVAEKNQVIAWIEGIAKLESELRELAQAKSELQTRLEAFAPEQERLKLANQALELNADYVALIATRKEQDTDRRTISDCQESLPFRIEETQKAEKVLKAASEQLESKKTEQQKSLPIIRKVRELDLKINEKNAPIKSANDSIAEISDSLESLKVKQNSDSNELSSTLKALEDLQVLLNGSKVDSGLVEQLAGLRGRFDSLKTLNNQLASKLKEVAQAEEQLQGTLKTNQEQATFLENEKRDLNTAQKSLTDKQSEFQKILGGRELSDWRQDQSLFSSQRELINRAIDVTTALSKSKQAIKDLAEQHATVQQEESSLINLLSSQTKKQETLEKEVELLETQLTLLKKIEDLEEARDQLQDGEPCPLCGAPEHPYAEGNIPTPNETQQRLTIARADLKSIIGEISNLKVKQAKLSKDLEQAASSQKEHNDKIEENTRLIGEIFSELPSDTELIVTNPTLEEKLRELQKENADLLATATKTVEAAESGEKILSKLRETVEKEKDSVAKAEREAQTASYKKETASQLLDRLKKEADGCLKQQEESLGQLQKELLVFGIESLSMDTLDPVLEQLTSRRDQWTNRNKEKTGLEQEISTLEIQIRHQAEQMQTKEADLKKQNELLTNLLSEQKTFTQERQEVFGNKNVDVEETRLAENVEAANKDLDIARQKWVTTSQALDQLKAKIVELEKAIGARDLQLNSTNESFLVRIKEYGFTDEENYKSACLPESERKKLTERSQKLADEKTAITSKEQEKTKLLEAERAKNLTQEPLEELKNAVAALVVHHNELKQEIGGIRQRLKDNESVKQKQKERVQAIDAQKREFNRWDLLHELIGSADGKKYRNFAQGLTFEMMVGHANRQLQKMTDRYLLIRDNSKPLELNVIDNYQSGEIRSTKNISGGESFIISLSLALGLSKMASQNVRVDSLFLDEGFGTLDEEALDTALETLSSLQQDGKLIGVISHVQALKERISTQIEVTPQTGGKSSIAGPGCEKVYTIC